MNFDILIGMAYNKIGLKNWFKSKDFHVDNKRFKNKQEVIKLLNMYGLDLEKTKKGILIYCESNKTK